MTLFKIAIVAGMSFSPGDSLQDLKGDFQRIADRYRAATKASGVIIAAAQGSNSVVSVATGTRSSGSQDLLLPGDRVMIGSVSKPIAAGFIASRIDRGELAWSSTVRQAFPELAKSKGSANSDVTIVQLLCHRSGLSKPFAPKVAARSNSASQYRLELLKEAFSLEPRSRIGEKYEYNDSADYAVAIWEKLTGDKYESKLATEFFEVLNLRTFTQGRPWNKFANSLVSEVLVTGNLQVAPDNWQPQLKFAASGAWSCSLEELVMLARTQFYGSRFVSLQSLDRLFTPPYRDGICLGWSGGSEAGWRSHAGSSALGDTTVLCILPRRQIAFAFAFNRNTGDPGIRELRDQMTEELKALIARRL